jgi:nucleoid-associated protein YgaU
MSEPHIIIGPAVGPGGPTTAAGGSAQATGPAGQTEISAATSTSMVTPEAEVTPPGDGSRSKAVRGAEERKHRAGASARARAAEPDVEKFDEPLSTSVKSADGDHAEKELETELEVENQSESPRAGRIPIKVARNLLIMLSLGLRALGSALWGTMVRYPRHALAAAASVVILGAIEYTQWRGAKSPPVIQISAKPARGSEASTGSDGSQTGKIAASGRMPKGLDATPGEASPTQLKKPETVAAAAPLPPRQGPGGSSLSAASAAPADKPLSLLPPNGQTGSPEGAKTAQAKPESAVVSAPGLLAADSDTLPPAPASSLGKDGATLLASSAESVPAAPAAGGGKEPAAREDGKIEPGAAAPFELGPAPSPSAAKIDKAPEGGDALKPAPTPNVKQPEQTPAPVPLPLDSLPAPAAKTADGALAPSPATSPAASSQTTEVLPPPPVEAAPPVTSPAAMTTEPSVGSSPAPERDKGSPDFGQDPARAPRASQSKRGTDTANPKPEPITGAGLAPMVVAQAKPKSDDNPELGSSLANPPPENARSEPKSTPDSIAGPSSIPQDSHKGEVPLVPKSNHEPEPSPAAAETGEKPSTSEFKPTQAPVPFPTDGLPKSRDADAKLESGNSKQDGAAEPPQSRAESHPDSITPAATEPAPSGWVPIRNSGKVPLAAGDELDPQVSDGEDRAASSDSIRDSRAHAAKGMTFEMESPGSRATLGNSETDSTTRAKGQSGSAAGTRRVETVPHVVEDKENFWTISRQYYGSGRYYRALWKANADRCPEIDGLYVNDVIIIPPPEDLDPSYIDPPGERPRSARAGTGAKLSGAATARNRRRDGAAGASEMAIDSPSPSAAESPSSRRATTGARTNQLSSTDDGIPIQRSSRTTNELELPAASSDQIFSRDRRSVERRDDLTVGAGTDDDPQDRAARRPRSAGSDSSRVSDTRPGYRVRPNDTLRSIARDTLGSARRANEILDLNRDIIDDPSNLIVGQMLELPEDARTSIRRPTSR